MVHPARRLVVAGLLTFAAAPVLAQTSTQPPPAGQRPGMGPGGGMMGGAGPGAGRGPGLGRMSDPAGYLDSLKTQLRISEQQTPAWNEYANTVTGVSGQMQAAHQSMWESMPTASWQERQGMMNTMFQARGQAYATVHDAAAKLLPSLTPAQRQQAEGSLPGLMPPGPGPGMGRGMGRGTGPGAGQGMMGQRPAVPN
ncbi:MAG: Spy/CpxP family protein refolding chaperone [Proteobacteria bacterium]|nr:Spy/CpxP family protein refolding chaperone [Pseudomonadota bacterium]